MNAVLTIGACVLFAGGVFAMAGAGLYVAARAILRTLTARRKVH